MTKRDRRYILTVSPADVVSRLLGCTASAVQPPVCDAGASLCLRPFFVSFLRADAGVPFPLPCVRPAFLCSVLSRDRCGDRLFSKLSRHSDASRDRCGRGAAFLPAPPYFHFRKKIGERVVFASPGMRFAFLPVQATAGNYTFVPISRTNMPLPAAIHASRVIHRGQATSIPIAPSGAVTRIESTATERIRPPQGRPIASGTPPMAACTVAFGRYAITGNNRSRRSSAVPSRER